MNAIRVIIAGSRSFSNYELLKQKCDSILKNYTDIIIISGTANGADKLGERYANECGYKLERYPADWDKYGRGAGHKRNAQMADIADACILFWDGVSPGSKSMMELAQKKNLQLRVIYYA